MALELKQSLRMTQQLVMTPQLQQAIKLLQLSRLELEQTIQAELLENPLLEESSEQSLLEDLPAELAMDTSEPTPPEDSTGPETREELKPGEEKGEIDWQDYFENYLDNSSAPSNREVRPAEELPSWLDRLSESESLTETLAWQLRMDKLSEEEEHAGMLIISNLDDDGYLSSSEGGDPLVALAIQAGISAPVADRVLRKIQRYEPIGCGSRDLQECLQIQAQIWMNRAQGDPDEADGELVFEILKRHMRELESKNLPQIARELKVSLDEVIAAVKVITDFEPKPGRSFSGQEAQYITPDVYVHKMGNDYTVVLNNDGLNRLRISEAYRSALNSKESSSDAKDYIKEKFNSAVFLIRSIHQRQQTIFKVTESIVKFQRDFLDHGVQHLKPLILRNVADDIGMHESTVSRVTTNKYVHTPQGIYELKFFFNSSIARTSGDDLASEAVKDKIKEIVASEPGKSPYSDQRIVDLLEERGIEIARRTVAKYREALGILPSSKRRKYF